MFWEDWIDGAIEKYGYRKVKENKYGATYEKLEVQGYYTHVIAIVRKSSGKHLIQSYDKECFKIGNEYFNPQSGFEVGLLFLLWRKYRKLKKKYKWEDVKII